MDERLKGIKVTIKGERGVYTIHSKETNPRNEKTWFVLIGGAAGEKSWRHKYPSQVKMIPIRRPHA